MAYDRQISLTVSGGSGGGAIDLSQFDIRFDVKQNTLQAPNTAYIRVFNVSRATSLMIPSTGGQVILTAGYADEGSGVIFSGTVFQRRIGKESPIVRFLDITCSSGNDAYNSGTVTKTLAAGSTPMDHVKQAVMGMAKFGDGGSQVSLGYVSPGLFTKPQFTRAVSLWGMSRDILRRLCKDAGAQWSIQDDGKVQIVADGDMQGNGTSTVTINSQTGMIGIPTETPNGIIVRTLLDPRLKVNAIVKINEADITRAQLSTDLTAAGQNALVANQGVADGMYRVLAIDRTGHLRGQEWYNDLVCIGATSGTATPGTAGTYTTADGVTHANSDATNTIDTTVPTATNAPTTDAVAAPSLAQGNSTGVVAIPTTE